MTAIQTQEAKTRELAFLLGLLGLFIAVVGVKFWMINQYAAPIPLMDPWKQEGEDLYKPLVQGTFDWGHLFRPAKEHRILFYGLFCISIFKLNGQWDVFLQLAGNAITCALIATFLAAILYRALKREYLGAILVSLSIFFLLPMAWQSELMAMHIQYLFGLLFAIAAVWGMGASPLWSAAWWVGTFCAAATLFTSGAGMLAAAAVAGMHLATVISERRITKGTVINLVASLAIVGAGLVMLVTAHAQRKGYAESPVAFLTAFAKNLSWPFPELYFLAAVFYLPLIVLAVLYLMGKAPPERTVVWKLLLGLGAFVVLNMAAIAYARGEGGQNPARRYFDFHVLGAVANTFGVLMLIELGGPARRKWLSVAAAVWGSLLLAGLLLESRDVWSYELPKTARDEREQVKNLKSYLATHDLEKFRSLPPDARGFPFPDMLAGYLDDPTIKTFLPPILQPPAPVLPTPETTGFAPDAIPETARRPELEKLWGSFGTPGETAQFSSQPIRLTSRYLLFETAGTKGTIRLMGANKRNVKIRNQQAVEGDEWRPLLVKAPDTQITIQAKPDGKGHWLAFAEPSQLTAPSYYIRRLFEQSDSLFIGGVSLLCAVVSWSLLRAPGGKTDN